VYQHSKKTSKNSCPHCDNLMPVFFGGESKQGLKAVALSED
jgi:hypothetical protein